MAKKHSGDKAEKADADRVQYEAWLKKRLPDSAKEKSKAEEFVAQIKALTSDYPKFDPLLFLQDLELSLINFSAGRDEKIEKYDKARKKVEAAIQKHRDRYEALKKELEQNPLVEKVTEEIGAKVPIVKWKK